MEYFLVPEMVQHVAGNAQRRFLTCHSESWQTLFDPHLADGFFSLDFLPAWGPGSETR